MADVSFERVFPLILPYAANCPEPVVINAVREACIEFCNETLVATRLLDPISIEANEPVVQLETLPGYDVVQLAGPLFFRLRKLTPYSPLELDQLNFDWANVTNTEPQAYVCFRPEEVTLLPTPTQAYTDALTCRVAYAPNASATRFDSLVVDGFRDALASGALGRILLIPDQPYTNEQKALYYTRAFSAAKANAASSVRASFMRAPMRVQYQKF